jgi:hypothetical protein
MKACSRAARAGASGSKISTKPCDQTPKVVEVISVLRAEWWNSDSKRAATKMELSKMFMVSGGERGRRHAQRGWP